MTGTVGDAQGTAEGDLLGDSGACMAKSDLKSQVGAYAMA